MKIYKQITDIFVKIVSVILMCLIASLVGVMLYELSLRNFLNKTFRASTELCGFLFMWMLYVRATPKVQTTFWMINKIFSLGLGIIMIVAYQGMYKINSTSYFSTMQFVSKAWHFLPMAIAGGFIVVKTVYQLMDRIVVPHGTNTN